MSLEKLDYYIPRLKPVHKNVVHQIDITNLGKNKLIQLPLAGLWGPKLINFGGPLTETT